MNFTSVETKILNRIQKDFPAVADPLFALADELSIPEEYFYDTLRDLKNRGIIRNISGIFNGHRLGFLSTLIAFSVEENCMELAAAAINSHPGVSHNYQRDHHYNIWFTLAAESECKLEQTVKILAVKSNARDYIILHNEKLLKIGLMLNIGNGVEHGTTTTHSKEADVALAVRPLSEEEKDAVRILQMDLPLEKNPFSNLINASKSSIGLDALISSFKRLKQDGVLRRYSAVLRHREAGYRFNAMTVWKPDSASDMERIAKIFHDTHMISHLYLRTLHPGKWEYPLFAMIHARTDGELKNIIKELSVKSGIHDYQVLHSLKEFKKERVVYFSPRLIEWDRQAGI